MVVVVVTSVVFFNTATENFNKNTKTSCLYSIFVCTTIHCKTNYNSGITNCSVDRAQVDGGRSPNHFGLMDPGILGIARKFLSF
jgi:hypothetical protein